MATNTIDTGKWLGFTAKDVITGFSGVVTGYCAYISGCHQVLLVARAEGGKEPVSAWYDAQRLKIDPDVPQIALDNGRTPGCDLAAPKR